jgi:predicted nucleotidyltransferase
LGKFITKIPLSPLFKGGIFKNTKLTMQIKTEKRERESELLESIKAIIVKELHPGKILLFGSRVKDESKRNTNSDFDIAIDGKMPVVEKLAEIKDKIESVAGLYRVDLVFLDSVDKDFKNIVLEEGRVIYEQQG